MPGSHAKWMNAPRGRKRNLFDFVYVLLFWLVRMQITSHGRIEFITYMHRFSSEMGRRIVGSLHIKRDFDLASFLVWPKFNQ
jgi:hypothetical protein